MLIQTHRHKRAVWFPVPEKKTARGIVLYLPGFPKYPGATPFTEIFLNSGFHVLIPMYSGTFESSGKFSLASSVQDVKLWHDFIQEQMFFINHSVKSPILIKRTILFSMSYGGLVGGLALKKFALPNIEKSIFVSPLWRVSDLRCIKDQRAITRNVSQLLKFAYPHSYRFANKEKFFREISEGIHQKSQKSVLVDPKRIVEVYCGKDDKVTPLIMARTLAQGYTHSALHELNGGHASRIDMLTLTKHMIQSLS